MSFDVYDLQYVSATLYGLSVIVVVCRLYLRFRTRLWFWDDTLVLIAVVAMSLFIAGLFLLGLGPEGAYHSRYPLILGYYIPIWFARLSILCTIIRLAPNPRTRNALCAAVLLFALECIFLIVEEVRPTAMTTFQEWSRLALDWKQPDYISISQIITAIVSDALLVFLPLWILHSVKIEPALRSRLLVAFCISIITTAAGIVHVAVSVTIGGIPSLLCAALEIFVALFVCNGFVLCLALAVVQSEREYSDATNQGSTMLSTIVNV